MTMSIPSFTLLIVLTALVVAAPAAQDASSLAARAAAHAQIDVQVVEGDLLAVDITDATITVGIGEAGEKAMTFLYNEQTEVTGAQDGTAGLAATAGERITVEYVDDGTETPLATRIQVRDEGGQSH